MFKLYDSQWNALPVELRDKLLLHKCTHPVKEEEYIKDDCIRFNIDDLWHSFCDKYSGCISGTSVLIEDLFYQYVISCIISDFNMRRTVNSYVKRTFDCPPVIKYDI